jgi:single-strand DNA-binding protein
MNLVVLRGRLTRDPDARFLPSGTPQMRCGIAVNRVFTRGDGTTGEQAMYIEIEAFAGIAEVLLRNMTKGRELLIRGFLEFDTWEDKATKERRQKHKVVIEQFEFIDQKPKREEQGTLHGQRD